MMKIYTSRASLCALGIYLNQHHLLDDLKSLSIPQKKDCPFSLGKNPRYYATYFSRGHSS
jgi:hypothetical protein